MAGWQAWAAQGLRVVQFVAVVSPGISYLQRLLPGRSGLASSACFAAHYVSNPVTGAIGAASIGALGFPGIFRAPAALDMVCLVAFTAVETRGRRPGSPTSW